MKKALLLALALFVVAAFVACGGDDANDPPENEEVQAGSEADTALSEEEFLAQGNAICAAGNKELDAAAGKLGRNPSEEELQALVDLLIVNVQGQIDALEVLEPPEDLAADVDALLADAKAALDKIKELGVKFLELKEDPFVDVNKAAGKIGLDECAEA